MKKIIRLFIVLLLFLGLILIRTFEYELFYDPLLAYFEGDHLTKPIPHLNSVQLFISYFFRYSLNTICSLLILKVSFPKNDFFKTISIFYTVAFIVLAFFLFSFICFKIDVGYLILFYIRRFIIQPIFVILLFPLLYLIKKGYTFDG